MTKNAITQRIRELAATRGNHVSYEVFLSETGIKANWLRSQEWYSGWNNLLAELELNTRVFRVPRTQPSLIAKAVAELIEREGRWPTEDDLTRERKRNNLFPSLNVIRPLRKSGELAKLIVALGTTDEQFAKAALIAKPYVTSESEASELGKNESVKGYVYLLRSGRRYKIGKSNDPSRRFREVRLELPDETHQVHTIPTDDPTGIEAYWHQRFAAKRVRNTEFFELDANDVQAFKRRKYQ